MLNQTAIVYVVEKGVISEQAKLLQNSIKQFLKNIPVSFAVCSREQYKPTKKTIDTLEALGANYIEKNLNDKYSYFPLCNGIYSSSYIERKFNKFKYILLVDTDTLFLNYPNKKIFDKKKIVVRPVDNKGIGSTGNNDQNDSFWQQIYKLFQITTPEPNLQTTIRKEFIRPYFNSGFVLSYRENQFFSHWQKVFEIAMQSNIRTNQNNSRHLKDYGFIEQATIPVAIKNLNLEFLIAPYDINYPIPFQPYLANKSKALSLENLCHIHYHKWFQHPGFLDYVTTEEDKKTEQYRWLKEQLPLQPTIDGPFKC